MPDQSRTPAPHGVDHRETPVWVSQGCHSKYHKLGGLKQPKNNPLAVRETRECRQGHDRSRGGFSLPPPTLRASASSVCSRITRLCLHHRMAFFPVCPFLRRYHWIWGPPSPVISFPCFPSVHLQGHCFQIRSHPETPGGHEFGGTPFNTLQPPQSELCPIAHPEF